VTALTIRIGLPSVGQEPRQAGLLSQADVTFLLGPQQHGEVGLCFQASLEPAELCQDMGPPGLESVTQKQKLSEGMEGNNVKIQDRIS
jgi:hypothetical protein